MRLADIHGSVVGSMLRVLTRNRANATTSPDQPSMRASTFTDLGNRLLFPDENPDRAQVVVPPDDL